GVEVFQRLDRVRQGPAKIVATYMVVLGLGFQGRYGLPGADRYTPVRLRRELALQLRVDTHRGWTARVLRPTRTDTTSSLVPKDPWYRSVWFGRALCILVLLSGLGTLGSLLAGRYLR